MIRARTLHRAFLSLVLGVSCAGALGAEPDRAIPADLVLERFPIAKGGDDLIVPVHFMGKDHLFLIDTGASNTIFDRSLLLGEHSGSEVLETPNGEIVIKAYQPPVASIGKLPFRVSDSVGAMDLQKLRDVIGSPLKGVLGMDFLGQQIVHIDFDKGELLFLKSAPTDTGDVVPMFWGPGETPEVVGFVAGADPIRFMIDTGAGGGFDSGSLVSQEVRNLAAKGKLRKVGSTRVATASGTLHASYFQGNLLALGGFAVEKPVFTESRKCSTLGLSFWSRFAVTFDFPGRRILLHKGAQYSRPDRWNLSGLHLVPDGDFVMIESVDEACAGKAAGVQKADVLLRLGELRAAEASLLELRSALCMPGQVECIVRRGSAEHRLTLNLKH